jgi:hypothetical protein
MTARLETWMKDVVRQLTGREDTAFWDSGGECNCYSFVLATPVTTADRPPAVLRSYAGSGIEQAECFIWQAARATLASPSLFSPILIENPPPGRRFISSGIGASNPSEIALDEARRL